MNTPHNVKCATGGSGKDKQIWAADLIATLEGKYEDKKHGLQGRREIIKNILDVRQNLEVFENEYLERKIAVSSQSSLLTIIATTELTVPDYATCRKPHLSDSGETIDATSADDAGDTLEKTPQPQDYDDGDTMVVTPSSNHDSPTMTEMPVFSRAPQKLTTKAEARNKTKRAPRQHDDGQQNFSFTGSTSSMGQNSMLSTSFSSDQMARPPHLGAPTPDSCSVMWNNGMPPSSNSLAQYSYGQFVQLESGSAHSQTQFPVENFQPMVMPQAQFESISEACPYQAYFPVSYTEAANPEQAYQHAAYGY